MSIFEFKFANNYILFESAIKTDIIIHGNIGTVFQDYSGTPINTVTNAPKKIGLNNEVTVFTRVSLQENVWSFLPGSQNKVTVLTR